MRCQPAGLKLEERGLRQQPLQLGTPESSSSLFNQALLLFWMVKLITQDKTLKEDKDDCHKDDNSDEADQQDI